MDIAAKRQRLLAMLQELRDTGHVNEDSKSSLRDYHHELTVFDNHPADVASEDFMRNLDAAVRENDANIIGQIQNAISRIDRGEYEHCTNCGRRISEARLEALPYADTCSKCADELGEMGGMGKPTSFPCFREDFTWPRFNQYGTSDSIQDQPRQVRDRVDPK